jgi:2-dehydro-3-deoxyphosphogluconate aldolase / (4S)-4-hydroxy-2-oxoglutarate aldolase
VSRGESGRPAVPEEIAATRVLAIGRGLAPDRIERVAESLAAGGIRAFEITMDSADAERAIATLAGGTSGLRVGAGTVLDIADAGRAIGAGAAFIVSPHTDPGLIAWVAERGIPVVPGAFSPSEALAAWRAGAAAIKLFPASVAGPAFVRELRGPFPYIPVVATGGVTLESAPLFVAAGAIAVGVGSWLTGDGDPERIAERAARIVDAVASKAPG